MYCWAQWISWRSVDTKLKHKYLHSFVAYPRGFLNIKYSSNCSLLVIMWSERRSRKTRSMVARTHDYRDYLFVDINFIDLRLNWYEDDFRSALWIEQRAGKKSPTLWMCARVDCEFVYICPRALTANNWRLSWDLDAQFNFFVTVIQFRVSHRNKINNGGSMSPASRSCARAAFIRRAR